MQAVDTLPTMRTQAVISMFESNYESLWACSSDGVLGRSDVWLGYEAVDSCDRYAWHELPPPSSVAHKDRTLRKTARSRCQSRCVWRARESRTDLYPHGWLNNHVEGWVGT